MLSRVRESYRRQAVAADWCRIDAELEKDAVAAAIDAAIIPRIGTKN